MNARIDQPWVRGESLQELLSVLQKDGGEARVVGGAVRNALLDQPIGDIDVATNLVPRDVILSLNAAGHKTIPTGIEHGTVTAVINDTPFEITTLRQDVETDGRHATVLYGTDWVNDAKRRDLTINALYMNEDGSVFDPIGGLPDILSQTVRFIDDPETRIREDYLRILRFFRFFAWYGKGRPDADGLRACARLKQGLKDLSVERVWHELSRLLAAPDPSRSLLWMRQAGVLGVALPETLKWGIDAVPGLIRAEAKHQWQSDALLRLMAIIPPQREKLSALAIRLKLPNKVRDRLLNWADTPEPDYKLKKDAFFQWLYWQELQAVQDRQRLAIARDDDKAGKFARQLKWANNWTRPQFPLRGKDLLNQGIKPGPQVSEKLKELERTWVESNFSLSKEALLQNLA